MDLANGATCLLRHPPWGPEAGRRTLSRGGSGRPPTRPPCPPGALWGGPRPEGSAASALTGRARRRARQPRRRRPEPRPADVGRRRPPERRPPRVAATDDLGRSVAARAPPVLGRSGLCMLVRGLPDGRRRGHRASRIVSRSSRPVLLADHQRLLEHVDEHARPHARRRRRRTPRSRPGGRTPRSDRGTRRRSAPGRRRPANRTQEARRCASAVTLGMGAEDHAVARQHQTAADPGDAQRDPLRECRVVAHPSWEASTGRPRA